MRIWAGAALILSFCAAAFADEADTKRQARAHFRAGTVFYDARAYDKAIAEYEEAYRLVPLPDFLFNLGQANRLNGDKAAAVLAYTRYLEAKPNGPVADEAREHVRQLRASIAAETPAVPEEASKPTTAPPAGLVAAQTPELAPPIASPPRAVPTSTTTPSTRAWTQLPATPRRHSKAWIAAIVVPSIVALGVTIGLTAWYASPPPSYTKLDPVQ